MKINNQNSVSVLGAGFIGVVTAIGLAEEGNKVICVDIDKNKIDMLRNLKLSFSEPGLEEKLKNEKINKLLKFTTDLNYAIANSNISFICVGTPPNSDRTINLEHIKKLYSSISKLIKPNTPPHIFVNRSTSLPGTVEELIIPILEKGSGLKEGKNFHVCSNPEFMREGCMVNDFLFPEVIVIGGRDINAINIVESTYGQVAKRAKVVYKVDYMVAEMTKYAFNCYLVTKISFANEIGLISDQLGIDGRKVMDILQTDERIMISKNYLNPGYAYGGSCLPKDPPAIINHSKKNGYNPVFFESIVKLNEIVYKRAIKLILNLCGDLNGKHISVFGVAFKENTSDIRESRVIDLICELIKQNAQISIVDPFAISETKKLLGNKVTYPDTLEDALKDSDICILGLKYQEFSKIIEKINLMRNPIILDLCDHEIQNKLGNTQIKDLVYKGIHW